MAEIQYPTLSSLESFLEQSFDFIVVGGGTAGLVVAARLSDNSNIQVGVLEAGPAHFGDPMILTPALYSQLYGNPEYDWCYKTVPQVPLLYLQNSNSY
jgi:choline dehydrogenase-like flavoprotein